MVALVLSIFPIAQRAGLGVGQLKWNGSRFHRRGSADANVTLRDTQKGTEENLQT